MSNLLNNDKPKKKLLNRGPKIVPEQEFVLEDKVIETPPVEQSETGTTGKTGKTGTTGKTAVKPPRKVSKKVNGATITSVRVTKATRNKLNALIQLGKADNVDTLIDILLDEYAENNLVKDEKKTYSLILSILQKRGR